MRQISSKFNIYVKNVSIVNNNLERHIFNFIVWSFGALLLSYVLFLGNMVTNIIERKNLETRARILSSEVRDLELAYLSISGSVDLAFSYSKGFKEAKTTFVTRKSLGLNSDFNSYKSFDPEKALQNDL